MEKLSVQFTGKLSGKCEMDSVPRVGDTVKFAV